MKRTFNIGFRLLFASLAVILFKDAGFMVQCILAAICLSFPNWKYIPGYLAEGAGAPDEEAQKALLKKIEDQVKSIMTESQKENVSKKDLDTKVDDLNKNIQKLTDEGKAELKKMVDDLAKKNENLEEQLKEANKTLGEQGTALKKLQDTGANGGNEEKPKSFREAVKEAILQHKDRLLVDRKDDFGDRLSMKDFFTSMGNRRTPEMTIKVAVDMLESNIVGANVATVRLTELDPTRVGIPLTIYPHVTDVFNKKRISRPYMSLLVVYTYFDGSDTKVEGAASGKSSFLFKTVEFKAFFIATHFKLSDETLDDLEEALDEISIVAPDKILDKIDEKILGSAGDDASDIAGILTANKMTAYVNPYATALDAGATIADVAAAAKLQAMNNKYRPNVIYLSPENVSLLASKKNTFEDSQSDRRVVYNNIGQPVSIAGLRIIESTEIVENEMIVFDSRQPWIGMRRDMTMEIGYDGTDLTEGQKTVVIKVRLAFGVRDKAGVIYVDDIQGAINGLEAGS